MTPYYADDWLTVYQGDCREVMASMEPESVHCVVTSPPYWGLRDYGTATWSNGSEWCPGPDNDSEDWSPPDPPIRHQLRGTTRTAWANSVPGPAGTTGKNAPSRNETKEIGGYCPECGATRQDAQLGLEPTPEEYVANMVAVFREVRRVLRADGTVWLNLGDSYASSGGERTYGSSDGGTGRGPGTRRHDVPASGLKPKDLVGIPWRVAFALQADGWYLRSDIIWSKPNPMPESITDRPTKAHEYLFLLSKSARYFYDADAVREAHAGPLHAPGNSHPETWQERRGTSVGKGMSGHLAEPDRTWGNAAGRNLRSVWTVATQPYPGAHFATFPEKLVEPCIKAGSPSDGTILDPFAGSGTVGRVAQRLSRRAVLIDLNADYLVQAMARNSAIPLGIPA